MASLSFSWFNLHRAIAVVTVEPDTYKGWKMKKIVSKIALVAIVCVVFVLSGCSGYNLSNLADRGQTVVTLSQNNYKVVKRVKAEVSSTRVFGIGGMSSNYLRNSAISKMYDEAQLTGSQTIVDIHVVVSKANGVFYTKEIMVATGTVIEFTGPNTTDIKLINEQPVNDTNI